MPPFRQKAEKMLEEGRPHSSTCGPELPAQAAVPGWAWSPEVLGRTAAPSALDPGPPEHPARHLCLPVTHLDGTLVIPSRVSISLRREAQEFTARASKPGLNCRENSPCTFRAHHWLTQAQACDPQPFPNHLHTNSVNSVSAPALFFSASSAPSTALANSREGDPPPPEVLALQA